jgi:hypothetical protein
MVHSGLEGLEIFRDRDGDLPEHGDLCVLECVLFACLEGADGVSSLNSIGNT